MLLVVAAGYVGYATWPVVSLNADVKSALEDALPALYRANLLPEPESTIGSDEVKRALVEKLNALGIAEPEAALTITRDKSLVAIAVKVDTAIDLKAVHKKFPLTLHPRVQTTADRVTY